MKHHFQEKLSLETDDLVQKLQEYNGPSLKFMEVCGTHTMSAARNGLYSILPESIKLISGPGCPVCVTPVGYIDRICALAQKQGTTIVTFGDMMRVPGSDRANHPTMSLATVKALGADVRIAYSPLDALLFAKEMPERHIIFPGIGFETTAPLTAATILRAKKERVTNFSVLSAQKLMPPALELLASSKDSRIDGFLCPGHVSMVIGLEPYRRIAENHNVPCVVAGFEPVEMLRALAILVHLASNKISRAQNAYPCVRPKGNPKALDTLYQVFEPCDSDWRGLGNIDQSGLDLKDSYSDMNAGMLLPVDIPEPKEAPGCRCADVLRGVLEPDQCSLFGNKCTPENPKGACMVSSEGSCAAMFKYRR